MKEIQIRIKGDEVRFIYSDDLIGFLEAGQARTVRASHVEPVNAPGSGWLVDLSPVSGPQLGPFNRKDEALAAEVEWLNQHGIPEPRNEIS